jgi:hypothetical protein
MDDQGKWRSNITAWGLELFRNQYPRWTVALKVPGPAALAVAFDVAFLPPLVAADVPTELVHRPLAAPLDVPVARRPVGHDVTAAQRDDVDLIVPQRPHRPPGDVPLDVTVGPGRRDLRS